jgi:histidine triad (HIT) family protein
MARDCVFCSIVDGEIPAHTVHETDEVLAFLDANPLEPGHALVIPKAHHGRLEDLPADLAASVWGTVSDLAPRIEFAVGADALSIGVNDGAAAGQEVPHVHVHVVPRRQGDGGGPIHAAFPGQQDLDDEELATIAESIRERA